MGNTGRCEFDYNEKTLANSWFSDANLGPYNATPPIVFSIGYDNLLHTPSFLPSSLQPASSLPLSGVTHTRLRPLRALAIASPTPTFVLKAALRHKSSLASIGSAMRNLPCLSSSPFRLGLQTLRRLLHSASASAAEQPASPESCASSLDIVDLLLLAAFAIASASRRHQPAPNRPAALPFQAQQRALLRLEWQGCRKSLLNIDVMSRKCNLFFR